MFERTANALAVFEEEIRAAERRLQEYARREFKIDSGDVWFRGQTNGGAPLLPSLLRFRHGMDNEAALLDDYWDKRPEEEARRSASVNVPDAWELLFEMQHYFVPTRLLDWSEDLDVALYFAFAGEELINPSVFLLHPGILNKMVAAEFGSTLQQTKAKLKEEHIRETRDQVDMAIWQEDLRSIEYLCSQLAGRPLGETAFRGIDFRTLYVSNRNNARPRLPIAIHPHENRFPRLAAQRGRFTIHGSALNSVDQLCPQACARVVFEGKIGAVLPSVEQGARTQFKYFPDKTSLAFYLKDKFGFTFSSPRKIYQLIADLWAHDRAVLDGSLQEALHTQGIAGCVVDKDLYIERSEKSAFTAWLDSPAAHRLAVVTAPAAAGKTNFLVDICLNELLPRKRPVLFYSVANVNHGTNSLLKNIAAALQSISEAMREWSLVDPGTLRKMFCAGEMVLVLDGLDELARNQGVPAILELHHDLVEISKAEESRVVIACRDHILPRLVEQRFFEGLPPYEHIRLEALDQRVVQERFSQHPGGVTLQEDVAEKLAQVPLFYGALRGYLAANSHVNCQLSSRLDFWKMLIRASLGKELSDVLPMLGRVAIAMLEQRSDYIDTEPLRQHLGSSFDSVTKARWPLLVQEHTTRWRFLHQAIREFVLAWNMKEGFDAPAADSIVSTTSSFDYESAETYAYLNDIWGKGKMAEIVVRVAGSMSSLLDKHTWNVFMRNYLETVGMLGLSENPEARSQAIDHALAVVQNSDVLPHRAVYVTRYNAARCLSRLHGTSPEVYCNYVKTYDRHLNKQGLPIVYGYAVRGFQEEKRHPSSGYGEVFRKALVPESRQREVCAVLVGVLENLCRAEIDDLHPDGVYLQINIGHALIRWYHGEVVRSRLERLWGHRNLHWMAKANLVLALQMAGEPIADSPVRVVPEQNHIKVDLPSLLPWLQQRGWRGQRLPGD